MVLKTAGIGLKISCAHELMPPVLETFLNSFSNTEQGPEYNLSITGDLKKNFIGAETAGTGNIVSEHPDGFILERHDARLSVSFMTKSIQLSLSPHIDNIYNMIVECLKWIFSFLIICKGGVPLHCSIAYRTDIGFGFLGPSEAGKTTLVKLLQPVWETGNDEFNAIMPENGRYMLYSTPFKASINYTMSVMNSVKASQLFFLKQFNRNYIENIPDNKKYFNLLKNIYTIPASRFLGNKLLENIQYVCDTVPIQMLYFINNLSILDFLAHYQENRNI
jgi:hypothetical protein